MRGAAVPTSARATAALLLATRDVNGSRRFSAPGFADLIAAYREIDAPTSLIETTFKAGRLTRDAIAIFAPLIRQAAYANGCPHANNNSRSNGSSSRRSSSAQR